MFLVVTTTPMKIHRVFFYVSEDYRNSCKSLADDKIEIPENVLSQVRNIKRNNDSNYISSRQQQHNSQVQRFLSIALMQAYAQSQSKNH